MQVEADTVRTDIGDLGMSPGGIQKDVGRLDVKVDQLHHPAHVSDLSSTVYQSYIRSLAAGTWAIPGIGLAFKGPETVSKTWTLRFSNHYIPETLLEMTDLHRSG